MPEESQSPRGGQDDPLALARESLAQLVRHEPQRHPLVVALVAPLGSPLDRVQECLEHAAAQFSYGCEVIHLSRLLDDLSFKPLGDLPDRDEEGYYEKRMNAGDEVRRHVRNGAALAAVAIARVQEMRDQHKGRAHHTIFVLRSLKHPAEERLLRHVYGDSFSLLAISSSADDCRDWLVDRLSLFDDARAEAERLMMRDEADLSQLEYGQNVRGVFSQADAYVPVVRGSDPRDEITRFVGSLFGEPFLTPRPEEEGMRLAWTAALRSAALGRQVGAALIPVLGTPVLVGTNEVAKPGGGQYWTGDQPDHRDFQSGEDPNPVYTRHVVQEVLERLAEHGWLTDEYRGLTAVQRLERAQQVLRGARAQSLIEFTRCLHAEQAAIVNAARAGVATQGATLYCTTFPCHECAKMIVGAGIVEMHYIEPYPKSMVGRLYKDIIETEPSAPSSGGLVGGRVPFRAFQGIAPRRYDVVFTAGERKAGTEAVRFDRPNAHPRTFGWNEDAVRRRESLAISAVMVILQALADSAKSSDDAPSPAPETAMESSAQSETPTAPPVQDVS